MRINYLHLLFLSIISLQSLTAQTYCASKGNLPWNEWIANVQFANINHASVKEGYGNFTSQTATVTRGNSYPFTLTRGFSWETDPSTAGQQARIWIDFNQNNIFDANELAAEFNRSYSIVTIPIPTTALLGTTRMRVSLKTLGTPTACEVFERGEVEDYTVNIGGGTTGNLPDLTMANLNLTNPTVQQGQILNYKFDLKNIGTSNAAGSFNVKSYISRDNVLSSDDIQDGIVPTGNFNAGFSVSQVPAASTIPATLAAGQYYLILKADADNQVIENNESNNIIVSLPFQVTANSSNNCLNRFTMEGFNFYDNNCTRSLPKDFFTYGTLQWYGATIETGFQATLGWTSNRANVFARNGTNIAPVGSNFRACAGNWVYFTAQGGSVIQDARSNNLEYSQLFIRIRIFGNAQNPDSLYLEVDTQNNNPNILLPPRFISSNKSLTCNSCFKNDRVAPTIANCPTTPIVNYTLPVPTNFTGSIINKLFNLGVNDNCGGNSTFQYSIPNAISFVTWDENYDYRYIAFDSAGNKATCAFRIHTVRPSQTTCKSYVTENTIDKCGSAPTWKPYGLKLYNYTTQQYEFYKIENANLSTSGEKAVLTGTFRTASWQPVQVKAYFKFFPSNGYRGSACGTGIHDTTGWQFPFADSGKIVFPDKTLAISGQSYREGQMGMGANTQDLNVLGFYSVARCANVSNLADDYNAFFSFKLTNETACSALTYSKSTYYEPVDTPQTANFNIFPNPARGETLLDLKDFENQPVEITVSDVAGKAVLNQAIPKVSVLPHPLDVSTLQNGTYFVRIQIIGQRSMTRTLYIMN